MMPRLVGLMLVVGCAAGRGGAPAPDAATADSAAAMAGVCDRQATVTVHVHNQSSFDIDLTFGTYAPAREAPGFSSTTYEVPRTYLNQPIRLRIARGGVATERPTLVPTEFVVCNDATLIIGARPSTSFFHGDLVRSPSPRPRDPDTTEQAVRRSGGQVVRWSDGNVNHGEGRTVLAR
jgi:hypothetical protein